MKLNKINLEYESYTLIAKIMRLSRLQQLQTSQKLVQSGAEA